jgi:hypothetical protein
MLKPERDYMTKRPLPDLCPRCAMTSERRARFLNACPFAQTPAEDVCPHYVPRSSRPNDAAATTQPKGKP